MTYKKKVTLLRLFADKIETECSVALKGFISSLIGDLIEEVYTTRLEKLEEDNYATEIS